MSLNLKIPCNETRKEIGIFNHIKVLYIPVGVTVMVSFKDTPKDDELYPLTDIVADLDAHGEMVEDAQRCFFHIDGASAEDIRIIASNVTPKGGYVHIVQKETIALEQSTKEVIESLGKLIEPYGQESLSSGNTNVAATVTLLSKTLDSDKIKVNLFHVSTVSVSGSAWIKCYLDGDLVCETYVGRGGGGEFIASTRNIERIFENCNGKTLLIESSSTNLVHEQYFTLQEKTLKP